MGLFGLSGSKTTSYDPLSAYRPEQQDSIKALMSLASTGAGGGITLGEKYGGDLGYYQQNPGELRAKEGLWGLVNGADMSGARDVYSSMANTQFNPDDPSSGYAAYSRALAKAGAESADVLNREAAMTGSRFGTNIQNQKADLAGDLANQRGMFLADLYNRSQDRALQGASGLQNLMVQQSGLYNQLQQQESIDRMLQDQKARDQYSEFNRTRDEQLSRLGLMNDQWQNPMGVITKKSPSTLMKMWGEFNPLVGSSNTHKYGYTTNQTSISDFVDAAMSMATGGMGSMPSGNTGTPPISPSNSRLTSLYNSGGFNPNGFGGLR